MKTYARALRSLFFALLIIALAIFVTLYLKKRVPHQASKKMAAEKAVAHTTSNVTMLKNTFKETVLQSKSPVMVNFFAEWCPSCNAVHPIIDEVAPEFKKIEFVSVNVDQFEEVANTYNVQAIPTFIFFNKGQVVDRSTGFMTKEQMTEFIKKNNP